MHLKDFKFFSSLRQPETQFRQEQGHQRASSVMGSINNFQNTTIAINRVEHQQAVNIKKTAETDYMVFGSNKNYFLDTCGKDTLEDTLI